MANQVREAVGIGCFAVILVIIIRTLGIWIGWYMFMPVIGFEPINVIEAFGLSLLLGALLPPRIETK